MLICLRGCVSVHQAPVLHPRQLQTDFNQKQSLSDTQNHKSNKLRCEVKWPLWPLLSEPETFPYFVSPGPSKSSIVWRQKLETLPCLGPPEPDNGQRQTPDTPSSKRTALDYCRRCWLFYLHSSHWCVCVCGCVCVCVFMCVLGKPICFFNEKKNTEGNTARERGGQKMEGLNDEVTWREVRSFQMGLHTHTYTHSSLCPTLLNLHNTEQDIAAACSLFTMRSQACWVNKS